MPKLKMRKNYKYEFFSVYLGGRIEYQTTFTSSFSLLRQLTERYIHRTNHCSGQCDSVLPLQGELEGVLERGHLIGTDKNSETITFFNNFKNKSI